MAGSKRDKDLARQKAARQEREAAEKSARRRRQVQAGAVVVAVIAVIAVVAGIALANNDDSKSTATSDPTSAASATPTGSANPSASSSPSTSASPVGVHCVKPTGKKPTNQQWQTYTGGLIPQGTYTEALTTNCGKIEFTLDAKLAPENVKSFTWLSDRGFFNHTVCHRLTTSGIYVLQCGDPTGTGKGSPGYTVKDENLPVAGADGNAIYKRGTVAMANRGPNTAGSQFFIVWGDSPLPPNYTVLGTVTQGMDIVDHVHLQGTKDGSQDGKPKQPLEIIKMISSVSYPAGPGQ